MANIVPKLNLNKTPSIVDNNSLIFAKNIRIDIDGTIHRDYGIMPMSIHKGVNTNELVDYGNLFNRLFKQVQNQSKNNTYYNIDKESFKQLTQKLVYIKSCNYKIVGVISDSNDIYIFLYGKHPNSNAEYSLIIRYNEINDYFYFCNCNWNWSGGTIYGNVIKNLVGDTILNIAEYYPAGLVPLKCINLNISHYDDDESIYTQCPNIPITNLDYAKSINYVIPNGVYQFFVRYKISKDFYTDWFPASNEIFVGNRNTTDTSFGTLTYIKTTRDSDKSFVLSVEHIVKDYISNYESFQIGFILSHDDATYARAWKHFNFDVSNINFDYKAIDAEEIEVSDLLKVTYGLYNVGNITSFKNKLYISNYTETDFNKADLQAYADKVNIVLQTKSGSDTYSGNPVTLVNIAGEEVISGLIIDNTSTSFIGANNLFDKIIQQKDVNNKSIKEEINKAINGEINTVSVTNTISNITISSNVDNIDKIKSELIKTYKKKETNNKNLITKYELDFDDTSIKEVIIDGVKHKVEDIIPYIYNTNRYLKKSCVWINDKGHISNTINIIIVRNVKVTRTETIFGSNGLQPSAGDTIIQDEIINASNTINIAISTEPYFQNITITFKAYSNEYGGFDGSTLINNTTLIPYQKYKFYIHYVKANGEITNGYYCNKPGEIEAPYKSDCNSIIYPIFLDIEIPDGYSACFFSISHTENISATVFNIKDAVDNIHKESSCIDVNMMLVPANTNIRILQDNKETYSGKYYYSSDSSIPKYFGADGILLFDKNNFDNNKLAYVVNSYSIPESDNIELVKCTPYLNKENIILSVSDKNKGAFGDYSKMNLLGYICSVTTLLRDVCIDYYSDGSSVYKKEITPSSTSAYNDVGTIHLKELSKYQDNDLSLMLANFSLKVSKIVNIYSNYNLNYVSLSEEPKMSIKTFYNRKANDTVGTSESQENQSNTILLRLLSSQLMSDIYELPSMYRTYIRKTYSVYNDSETTTFQNTIRSSILYGDEYRVKLIKFDANDYYNVPTNRGIITNLVAVGDMILVHTRDSIFRFSGSNTIQATNGEILTPESKPFETGISEVFGSDYGFAGLQNKEEHIITELGYIFYDSDSKIIYMYSGQGQIIKLSDSIEKLFKHKPISNVVFANDYYNNRIFVCVYFSKTNINHKDDLSPVTLSFNISENVKSFVSIHDFCFKKAFNTKTNCYFGLYDKTDICTIDKELKGIYHKLEINDKNNNIYPYKHELTSIVIADDDNQVSESVDLELIKYDSFVDIIENNNLENVKTLNSINWCGGNITSNGFNYEINKIETNMVAQDNMYINPCKTIMVYTDTCCSKEQSCIKRSNDQKLPDASSYMYPRYNQGGWTHNYFRSILNRSKGIDKNYYVSDSDSLIEGRYFVVRFTFDRDFILETLTLNYNNKI